MITFQSSKKVDSDSFYQFIRSFFFFLSQNRLLEFSIPGFHGFNSNPVFLRRNNLTFYNCELFHNMYVTFPPLIGNGNGERLVYIAGQREKISEYDYASNKNLNNLIVKAFMMDFCFFNILSGFIELTCKKTKLFKT